MSDLQVLKAREMYEERDVRGRRRSTVAQIAETFAVLRKTV